MTLPPRTFPPASLARPTNTAMIERQDMPTRLRPPARRRLA